MGYDDIAGTCCVVMDVTKVKETLDEASSLPIVFSQNDVSLAWI